MKKSNSLLKIAIIIIIIIGLAGTIYLIGQKLKKSQTTSADIPASTQTTPESSSSSPQIKSTEDQAVVSQVKQKVTQFEKSQQQKNAIEVLALFTPPQTAQEKEVYDFLLGRDIDETGKSFRLYNTAGTGYELESFDLGDCSKTQDNNYLCSVRESRRWWNNVEGRWTNPETKSYNITVVKQNSSYLIDKYSDPNAQSSTEKYSGFGV